MGFLLFGFFMKHAIPLSKQLEYYKEYQSKLVGIAGNANASAIISGAVYLIGAGSSDFIQNYYINPLLYKVYTPDQFSDILIQSYVYFVQVINPLQTYCFLSRILLILLSWFFFV